MKAFITHHVKFIIIFSSIIVTAIIGCFVTINVLKTNNHNDIIQSNERNKDKIQIEIITDSVKIRAEKNSNSKVIGNVYKNEIYDVISEDKDSQYKWLEIETANGLRGYIMGIEAYVKRLETSVIVSEENRDDNNITNDQEEKLTTSESKPNNNSTNTQEKPSTNESKPNNSNDKNLNNKPNNNQNEVTEEQDKSEEKIKEYDVTFIFDGKVYETHKIQENQKAGKPPDPYKTSYIFLYWSYNGEEYDFNTPVKNDIELTAVFKYISYEDKIKARETFKTILNKYGYTFDNSIRGMKKYEKDKLVWETNFYYIGQSYYIFLSDNTDYDNPITIEYFAFMYDSAPSCKKNGLSIECALLDAQTLEYAKVLKNDLIKISKEFESYGYTDAYLT